MATTSIDLRGLGFGYGPQPVVHDVTAAIGAGSRVAIVGPNGAGKSTLLRLVAGLEAPESGSVTVAPAGATVGFLPQERDRRLDETLGRYLARRTGVAAAEAAMQSAADALARMDPAADPASDHSADMAYSTALDHYLAIGGPDLEGRAAGVLAELGLDPDHLPQATATLSGGELARAALAAILLSQVDLLLLDEPTNDLDAEGLARLEDYDRTLRVCSIERAGRRSGPGKGSAVRHRRRPVGRRGTSPSARPRSRTPRPEEPRPPRLCARWTGLTPLTIRTSRGTCDCGSTSPRAVVTTSRVCARRPYTAPGSPSDRSSCTSPAATG